MSGERERLAADLLKTDVDWSCSDGSEDWHKWTADRLIALGWTRLDEDRLARALVDLFPTVQRDRWPFTPRQAAAAIAKAYREDT